MPKKQAKKKNARRVVIKTSPVRKKIVKVAAGTAAGLAAAGAAAYLFTGKQGKKTRSAIKKTAGKIGKEVKRESRVVKRAAKQTYGKSIDAISSGYNNLKGMDSQDFMEFTDDLKKRWGQISKEAKGAGKSLKKFFPAKKSKAAKTVKKSKSIKRH